MYVYCDVLMSWHVWVFFCCCCCLSVCLKRVPPPPRERWWVWRRGRQTTSWLELIPVTMATRANTPPGRTPWQVSTDFSPRCSLSLLTRAPNLHAADLCRDTVPACIIRQWDAHSSEHWRSNSCLLCFHYLNACRCLFVQTVYLIIDTVELWLLHRHIITSLRRHFVYIHEPVLMCVQHKSPAELPRCSAVLTCLPVTTSNITR